MSSTRKTAGPPSASGLYVAYYRVSDPKQGRSGLGLEAQRTAVERYVSSVKGELLSEYVEVETGKRHGKRPRLKEAIEEAKKRKATLLIAKLDRLARSVAFISNLMEAAVDFVAVDMPSANRLTIHIFAAMAEHEGEMISQRTKDGLAEVTREIQEKGFRISRTSGRRFTKLGNPRWQEGSLERARATRQKKHPPVDLSKMISGYRNEGLTLRRIADKLNELGLKTPSGAQWYASTVRANLPASQIAVEDLPKAA